MSVLLQLNDAVKSYGDQLLLDSTDATSSSFDAPNQDWATNQELFVHHALGDGILDVRITDEESKMPINRATPEQWEAWRKEPLTIMSLGPAVAQGKIQFKAGDYRAMIRQIQLAKPFLHFFTIL